MVMEFKRGEGEETLLMCVCVCVCVCVCDRKKSEMTAVSKCSHEEPPRVRDSVCQPKIEGWGVRGRHRGGGGEIRVWKHSLEMYEKWFPKRPTKKTWLLQIWQVKRSEVRTRRSLNGTEWSLSLSLPPSLLLTLSFSPGNFPDPGAGAAVCQNEAPAGPEEEEEEEEDGGWGRPKKRIQGRPWRHSGSVTFDAFFSSLFFSPPRCFLPLRFHSSEPDPQRQTPPPQH